MSPNDSPDGYRMTPVKAARGEHGHRIGNLASRKGEFGLAGDDGYTLCLLLDGADTRVPLEGGVTWFPVIFRFDSEWSTELAYRLGAHGRITLVREPWGDCFGPMEAFGEPWWPPRGDWGVEFTPIPDRLRDIFGRARWGWYGKQPLLTQAEWDYVDTGVHYFGGGFHQLLGKPGWVQEPIAPVCPDCGKQMPFLLSLDSSTELGWIFGDVGRLYTFYCGKCRMVVSEAQCT